ncbi:hypothetical protein BKA67DRAFT_526017 [Truncatella angustata]|uniref:Protein required for cell viability n=1 Tax=Truncatella angustata TaxID=152316 RepID=A0A9P8UCJ9_9PEZI|nr:uncharacterized protein BKA67DRAFT_526017 [Truncatella angustata]KAH6645892.1 hypothetical protein BKA67DRAFT_526017 [Truncatella angustata]KAH8205277.1 hypothetical protein TruAng_000524 [Truncatella angustata]
MSKTAAATQGSLHAALETIGTKAFDPTSNDASRAEGQKEFGVLISRTGTSSLIAALNALIKPSRVPRWLALRFMDVLTLLPQRPDGVRATLEFVFTTHPSSTVKASEAAGPQKRGANITMEALKIAANLLSAPPAGVPPKEWYPGIAPQLLALLDGTEGSDLVKVASYVIGFGILGRRQFGAPGTAGWTAFATPMLAAVNPSLSPEKSTGETLVFSAGPDEVVDLQRETVIVRSDDLAHALKRLTALLNSHPNPGLSTRLLSPLLKPLWALSSWPDADQECSDAFCTPAKKLLTIYLKISGSAERYTAVIEDLLYNGDRLSDDTVWQYGSEGSQIKAQRIRNTRSQAGIQLDLASLGAKATSLVELMQDAASEADISKVFLTLFRTSFRQEKSAQAIKIKVDEEKVDDPMKRIFEIQVLQTMMDRIPEKLVAGSKGLLELAHQVLTDYDASSENPDSVAVALSLLNIVITAPSFQKSDVDGSLLASIEASLGKISSGNHHDISQTANNLSLLLKYRDEIEDPSERPTAPTDRQVEDRKTYNLALSYITQLDSPPPVRSEGLNLISNLIRANSPILDIQGVLVLCSSLLGEDEDYINARVMKLFVQLAEKHPKSVIKELLDHYVDADEKANVDTRLRFGETILQVTQRLGNMFTGDAATQVGESMLSTAGRRGHRPKTEERQTRDQRLRERKQKAAEKAWGGDVPDLSELQEEGGGQDQSEEEKARNDILAQILQGWESKRGSEDVRIRASALSVFSIGLETNISGYGSTLVEASVDLCLNILTIEAEVEKAILRRAAIILVLTFVRALADAKESGRRLGFGLTDASREDITRILEYVAGADNDGLVQQHARDVVESLQNFQMATMLPEARDPPPGLAHIAGLNLGRPDLPSLEPQSRPRIEEIE